MTAGPPRQALQATPGLGRRLACFVYEGVLLFGVSMVTALAYGIATQQRHALDGALGLRALLVSVTGAYFVTSWSRSGQTLPMQTWRIKLVSASGGPVSPARAVARYMAAWMWFVPALLSLHFTGLKGGWPTAAALGAGVLGYAALVWLRADRQYWHDALCGTRLVNVPPTAPIRS